MYGSAGRRATWPRTCGCELTCSRPLLQVALFINVVFFARIFMPWLTRTMGESKRVAHLLSDLPPELSVEKILAETFSAEENRAGAIAGADAS